MIKEVEKRLNVMKGKLNVLLWILPVMAMFALPSYGSEEAK